MIIKVWKDLIVLVLVFEILTCNRLNWQNDHKGMESCSNQVSWVS